MKINKVIAFGLLGLIASMMVGMGEFLIHFNPEASSDSEFGYFIGIPQSRFMFGQYIMIPFIPLYIFGYYHLYLALKPGNKVLASILLGLGIFAFVIGGIWVGSRAHLGFTVQALAESNAADLKAKILSSYVAHVEYLVQFLRILILFISILFVWIIIKGGTLYPKWMAFFNPITLLIIVFLLFFYVRPIGQYLAPTAMNVAHLILFSASLISIQLQKQNVKTKNA